MEHLLNVCLVKHSQRGKPLSVLQAVPHCWLGCCYCISLPLLLLLLLLLLLSRVLVSWQVGAADEAFSLPLHPVQQVKVTVGTGHPGERRVFHDRSDLSLVQGQQAVRGEEVTQALQQLPSGRLYSPPFRSDGQTVAGSQPPHRE